MYAGEKYLAVDRYDCGCDPADNEGMFTGINNDTHRTTRSLPLQDREGLYSNDIFGSVHGSALHVALCDGAVRSVSYSVDRDAWRYFGNKEDQLAVANPAE